MNAGSGIDWLVGREAGMNRITARLIRSLVRGAAATCAWWAVSGLTGVTVGTRPTEVFLGSARDASVLDWAWQRQFPAVLVVSGAIVAFAVAASDAKRPKRSAGLAGASAAGCTALLSLAGVALFLPIVVTGALLTGSMLSGEMVGEMIAGGLAARHRTME